jgi:hypothetical protein
MCVCMRKREREREREREQYELVFRSDNSTDNFSLGFRTDKLRERECVYLCVCLCVCACVCV